jgi:hypothetical protein
VIEFDASRLDSASLRPAGKELLSLALIEARNHTLRWASALEAAADGAALALPGDLPAPLAAELDPALWTLGHIGWFQEYWIARNVQRGRGERADPTHPRLASIVPEADAWYDPTAIDRSRRRDLAISALPDLPATRAYLVDTLETTLELLAGIAVEDDASLYFHRLALFHEEMHGEAFAVVAQTLGIEDKAGLVARITTRPPRPPLYLPATRWLLGSSGAGFRFDNEAEPHPVDVPSSRSTRKPSPGRNTASSSRMAATTSAAHWSLDGWDWLQREGAAHAAPRRPDAPRRPAAALRRARPCRRRASRRPRQLVRGRRLVPLGRPAPAQRSRVGSGRRTRAPRAAFAGATCTSGRRRPSDPTRASSPARGATTRCPRSARARCCAVPSFATRPSLRSARLRGFAPAERDDGFFGFRSCAA